MRTLFLDQDTWDLALDGAGQIKVTSGPYAIAQNVANACRLFTNDAWYDPDKGIPHFAIDLGQRPSVAVVRNRIRKASLSVEGVANADVQVEGVTDRNMTGNIALTLEDGTQADVGF